MMTRTIRILLFLLASLWLSGAAARGLTVHEARHLLARTGFGVTESGLNAVVGLSRATAVDRLLAGVQTAPVTAAPEWVEEPPPRRGRRDSMSEQERTEFRRAVVGRAIELRCIQNRWYPVSIRMTWIS